MHEFNIPQMTCAHCKATIERAVRTADPNAIATIDVASKRARIDTVVDPSAIAHAIEDAGYAVSYTED